MRRIFTARLAFTALFFLSANCADAKEQILPKLPTLPRKVFPGGPGQLVDEGGTRAPEKIPENIREPAADKPWLIRMMIHDIKNGMFIGLPIIDTDPNRGATYGVMPIWVWQGGTDKRIKHIWAPSLSYNKTFQWIATHRQYYYRTKESSYFTRVSASPKENPDVVAEMEDLNFHDKGFAVTAKFEYDTDGSNRFFGLGPDSRQGEETNFTKKTLGYFLRLGVPVFQDSGWKVNVAHKLAATRIAAGLINAIPDIGARFPEQTPSHWHQDSAMQIFLDYDTRDNATTTRTGSYFKFLIENAQRGMGSEYTYSRYGFDLRHFYQPSNHPKIATASRFRIEQLIGDVPFHILPSLGGKTTHRAYGDGRYVDKGMLTATIEERFTVFEVETAGVMTELQLAPFIGIGSVFNVPGKVHRKHMRPVVGGAVRAVARPQVVGSIDVGVGQEGPAVFMDINYSF
jgi:hypothetical protein